MPVFNGHLRTHLSSKIVINGLSAGVGLAAGLALMCRDNNQSPPLPGQWLFSPMIDDYNDSASAHAFEGIGIWDRKANMAGWSAYLGDRRGTDNVGIYAAPARATDLSTLPSMYIDTRSTETLRDEKVAYAQKLWRDGTQCE
jgi:acetyl esterase/lipase